MYYNILTSLVFQVNIQSHGDRGYKVIKYRNLAHLPTTGVFLLGPVAGLTRLKDTTIIFIGAALHVAEIIWQDFYHYLQHFNYLSI